MRTPTAADDIFIAQHNVASRTQLLTVVSAAALSGMVRHGRLIARHRGVYHPAGVALCEKGEAMAALLRCPEGSCLTGPLGLKLLGVDGFLRSDAFDVLLPPGTRHPRGVDFRCRSNPSNAPIRNLGPLRLAAPARLLIDSGRPHCGMTAEQLWRGYDRGRWNGLFTTARFVRELALSARQDAGALRWRGIADDRLLKLESPKERELDPYLRRFDPVPEVQVYVTPSRRLDFFWRRFRLALEYLGEHAHAHRAARLLDAERDVELQRVGIRTITVTKADLADPDALLAHLLDRACARASELGVRPPVLRRARRQEVSERRAGAPY